MQNEKRKRQEPIEYCPRYLGPGFRRCLFLHFAFYILRLAPCLIILVKLQKLSLHGLEQAKYLRGFNGQHHNQGQ